VSTNFRKGLDPVQEAEEEEEEILLREERREEPIHPREERKDAGSQEQNVDLSGIDTRPPGPWGMPSVRPPQPNALGAFSPSLDPRVAKSLFLGKFCSFYHSYVAESKDSFTGKPPGKYFPDMFKHIITGMHDHYLSSTSLDLDPVMYENLKRWLSILNTDFQFSMSVMGDVKPINFKPNDFAVWPSSPFIETMIYSSHVTNPMLFDNRSSAAKKEMASFSKEMSSLYEEVSGLFQKVFYVHGKLQEAGMYENTVAEKDLKEQKELLAEISQLSNQALSNYYVDLFSEVENLLDYHTTALFILAWRFFYDKKSSKRKNVRKGLMHFISSYLERFMDLVLRINNPSLIEGVRSEIYFFYTAFEGFFESLDAFVADSYDPLVGKKRMYPGPFYKDVMQLSASYTPKDIEFSYVKSKQAVVQWGKRHDMPPPPDIFGYNQFSPYASHQEIFSKFYLSKALEAYNPLSKKRGYAPPLKGSIEEIFEYPIYLLAEIWGAFKYVPQSYREKRDHQFTYTIKNFYLAVKKISSLKEEIKIRSLKIELLSDGIAKDWREMSVITRVPVEKLKLHKDKFFRLLKANRSYIGFKLTKENKENLHKVFPIEEIRRNEAELLIATKKLEKLRLELDKERDKISLQRHSLRRLFDSLASDYEFNKRYGNILNVALDISLPKRPRKTTVAGTKHLKKTSAAVKMFNFFKLKDRFDSGKAFFNIKNRPWRSTLKSFLSKGDPKAFNLFDDWLARLLYLNDNAKNHNFIPWLAQKSDILNKLKDNVIPNPHLQLRFVNTIQNLVNLFKDHSSAVISVWIGAEKNKKKVGITTDWLIAFFESFFDIVFAFQKQMKTRNLPNATRRQIETVSVAILMADYFSMDTSLAHLDDIATSFFSAQERHSIGDDTVGAISGDISEITTLTKFLSKLVPESKKSELEEQRNIQMKRMNTKGFKEAYMEARGLSATDEIVDEQRLENLLNREANLFATSPFFALMKSSEPSERYKESFQSLIKDFIHIFCFSFYAGIKDSSQETSFIMSRRISHYSKFIPGFASAINSFQELPANIEMMQSLNEMLEKALQDQKESGRTGVNWLWQAFKNKAQNGFNALQGPARTALLPVLVGSALYTFGKKNALVSAAGGAATWGGIKLAKYIWEGVAKGAQQVKEFVSSIVKDAGSPNDFIDEIYRLWSQCLSTFAAFVDVAAPEEKYLFYRQMQSFLSFLNLFILNPQRSYSRAGGFLLYSDVDNEKLTHNVLFYPIMISLSSLSDLFDFMGQYNVEFNKKFCGTKQELKIEMDKAKRTYDLYSAIIAAEKNDFIAKHKEDSGQDPSLEDLGLDPNAKGSNISIFQNFLNKKNISIFPSWPEMKTKFAVLLGVRSMCKDIVASPMFSNPLLTQGVKIPALSVDEEERIRGLVHSSFGMFSLMIYEQKQLLKAWVTKDIWQGKDYSELNRFQILIKKEYLSYNAATNTPPNIFESILFEQVFSIVQMFVNGLCLSDLVDTPYRGVVIKSLVKLSAELNDFKRTAINQEKLDLILSNISIIFKDNIIRNGKFTFKSIDSFVKLNYGDADYLPHVLFQVLIEQLSQELGSSLDEAGVILRDFTHSKHLLLNNDDLSILVEGNLRVLNLSRIALQIFEQMHLRTVRMPGFDFQSSLHRALTEEEESNFANNLEAMQQKQFENDFLQGVLDNTSWYKSAEAQRESTKRARHRALEFGLFKEDKVDPASDPTQPLREFGVYGGDVQLPSEEMKSLSSFSQDSKIYEADQQQPARSQPFQEQRQVVPEISIDDLYASPPEPQISPPPKSSMQPSTIPPLQSRAITTPNALAQPPTITAKGSRSWIKPKLQKQLGSPFVAPLVMNTDNQTIPNALAHAPTEHVPAFTGDVRNALGGTSVGAGLGARAFRNPMDDGPPRIHSAPPSSGGLVPVPEDQPMPSTEIYDNPLGVQMWKKIPDKIPGKVALLRGDLMHTDWIDEGTPITPEMRNRYGSRVHGDVIGPQHHGASRPDYLGMSDEELRKNLADYGSVMPASATRDELQQERVKIATDNDYLHSLKGPAAPEHQPPPSSNDREDLFIERQPGDPTSGYKNPFNDAPEPVSLGIGPGSIPYREMEREPPPRMPNMVDDLRAPAPPSRWEMARDQMGNVARAAGNAAGNAAAGAQAAGARGVDWIRQNPGKTAGIAGGALGTVAAGGLLYKMLNDYLAKRREPHKHQPRKINYRPLNPPTHNKKGQYPYKNPYW
jgi:hypothetical protein